MSAPSWLQAICSQSRETRPNIADPHSVTIDGRTQTVATDGLRMVVLDADYGLSSFEPSTASVLVGTPRGVPFPLAEFRTLVAGLPAAPVFAPCAKCNDSGTVACPECDGEGGTECECICGHTHESRCRHCDNTGSVKCECGHTAPPPQYVRIGTHAINVALIAEPPELLGDGPLTVWVSPAPNKPLHFYGDGRRIVIMPVLPGDESHVLATLDLSPSPSHGGTPE